jgi:hypothetical protein
MKRRGSGRRSTLAGVAVGAVSGAMMATTSVGGPPVLLYLLSGNDPPLATWRSSSCSLRACSACCKTGCSARSRTRNAESGGRGKWRRAHIGIDVSRGIIGAWSAR